MTQRKKKYRTLWCCNGQAVTEFVIAAVFVLVPLFIIIPLVGNYIDIQHAAIGQARYEAWEYTAWFGPHEHIMTGVDDFISGVKKYEDTQVEGQHYFFSNFWGSSYVDDVSTLETNPAWKDHRGDSLFVQPNDDLGRKGQLIEGKTLGNSFAASVFNFIIDFMGKLTSLFGDLLHLLGVKATFDAIYTGGYFSSEVQVQVRSLPDILPFQSLSDVTAPATIKPLTVNAKAAVLSNSWNAAGREHAAQESRGLVLTALLSPISDTVNTLIYGVEKVESFLPIKGIELPGMPDFGYVKDDLVPYEHLEENTKETKTSYKLSYYGEKEKKK